MLPMNKVMKNRTCCWEGITPMLCMHTANKLSLSHLYGTQEGNKPPGNSNIDFQRKKCSMKPCSFAGIGWAEPRVVWSSEHLLQQIAPGAWLALLNFPTINFKFLCLGKSELVLNLSKFCHVLFSLACYQLRVNMLSLITWGNNSTMYVQNHHTQCFKSKQKKITSVDLILLTATVLPRSLTVPRKRM